MHSQHETLGSWTCITHSSENAGRMDSISPVFMASSTGKYFTIWSQFFFNIYISCHHSLVVKILTITLSCWSLALMPPLIVIKIVLLILADVKCGLIVNSRLSCAGLLHTCRMMTSVAFILFILLQSWGHLYVNVVAGYLVGSFLWRFHCTAFIPMNDYPVPLCHFKMRSVILSLLHFIKKLVKCSWGGLIPFKNAPITVNVEQVLYREGVVTDVLRKACLLLLIFIVIVAFLGSCIVFLSLLSVT